MCAGAVICCARTQVLARLANWTFFLGRSPNVHRNANLMHLSNGCRITSSLLAVPRRRHIVLVIKKRRCVSVASAMKVEEGHRMNSRSVQLIHCSHGDHASPSNRIACVQAAEAPHFCVSARQGRGNQGSLDLPSRIRRIHWQASGQEDLSHLSMPEMRAEQPCC